MELTTIGFTNFRGGTAQYTLGDCTVLQGPNGVGKTRILNAIALALTGAVPHPLEPRNIELVDLFTASNAEQQTMSVVATFAGGPITRVERVYTQRLARGKVQVSQSIEIEEPKMVKRTVPEAEKFLRETFGEFPAALDIHKFVRMSRAQRAALVLGFAQPDGRKYTAAALIRRLITADDEAEGGAQLATARGTIKGIAATPQSPSKRVADILEALAAAKKEMKKEAAQYEQATAGSINLSPSAGGATAPGRSLPDIDDDLAAARKEYQAAVEDKAKAQAAADAVRNHEQLVATLKRAVDEQNQMQALPPGTSWEELGKLEAAVREWDDIYADAKLQAERLAEMRVTDGSKRIAIGMLEENVAALERVLGDLARGACPTCGAPAAEAEERIRQRLAEQEEQLQQHRDKLRDFRVGLQQQANLSEQAHVKAKEEEQANAERQAVAGRMRRDLEAQRAQQGQLEAARRRWEDARKTAPVAAGAVDVAALDALIDGLKLRGNDLNEERRARIEYDTRQRLAKEGSLKAKELRRALEVVDSFIARATEVRQEIVEGELKRYEASINESLRPLFKRTRVMSSPRFAFRTTDARGNDDFSMAWVSDNQWTGEEMSCDFDVLSTSQQLWTLVAMLAPMLKASPAALQCLLLDNVEVLEAEARSEFLDMLRSFGLGNVLVAASGVFLSSGQAVFINLPVAK